MSMWTYDLLQWLAAGGAISNAGRRRWCARGGPDGVASTKGGADLLVVLPLGDPMPAHDTDGELEQPVPASTSGATRTKAPSKGAGPGDAAKRKKTYDAPAAKPKPQPVTAKEKRVAAKEMSESRKMKRKPNYNLEKELAVLWEKMRCRDVSKENRSKLVTEALRKMDGKYFEIAGSHVTARVLQPPFFFQTCVKWCSQPERDAVFVALQPHLLHLSRKKYAVFLVKKLIKLATKKQLALFISSLHGHVASLLRHTIGAAVVDCTFHQATPPQKRSLLLELYSTELQLFKDLTEQKSCSLLETISKLGLQKSSVLQYMTTVIQPLLEKGIVEYSIVHTVILEYLTIADKTSALDVIRQLIPHLTQGSSVVDGDELSGVAEVATKSKAKKKRSSEPLLIRIMQTREGLKIGLACLKHGSAKDRKKIIKSLKGQNMKLALGDYGCLFLACLLSIVDDTKLVTKVVIDELTKHLKELIFDKDEASESATKVNLDSKLDDVADKEHGGSEDTLVASDSKKDPFKRRQELLVKSELFEVLIETCIENVGELLRTNFGKDVLYEVAVGGKNNVLEGVTDRIHVLHNAIASDAARPRTEDVEHAFDNYHSSRVIRKMILDCPEFAATLWKKALKGKCKSFADGFSSKVVAAYLESPDSKVKDLAKSEVQLLIDSGILKIPDHKAAEKKY
ncbi:Pumilio-like protein 24 [Triticum urartu]|uniref:Pumilio-like protein 24 n=1 Tax=Triticum urartu TaxID=4572 RepID=M8B0B8_TRIUA|nr:Pumilio-like protein 24 [Triticum urartu]